MSGEFDITKHSLNVRHNKGEAQHLGRIVPPIHQKQMTDCQELELVRNLEIAEAYKRLVDLVVSKYNELEENNPRLVKLAKGFAINQGQDVDDLCYSLPKDYLTVNIIDGKQYPHLGSFVMQQLVPLWVLYVGKAREALEILDKER